MERDETHMVTNREISDVFLRIAEILDIQGEASRRIRAYERAAESIAQLERSVTDVWREGALEDIPGIGAVLAQKIEEMLTTGHLSFYEQLKASVPPGVVEMLRIQGVGPRGAARFWKELGVTTIDELESAARAGRVQALSRMGARTEARLIEGIEALRRWSGRVPLGTAWYETHALLAALGEIPGVARAAVAGSLRRMRDTVHDADLLAAADAGTTVLEQFAALPAVAEVLQRGETKASIRTASGLQVDLRVVEPRRWGTALQYFTGSQSHNVRLRSLARRSSLSLSEYALTGADGTEALYAEERDVYERLGLPWIPPELREDSGEFEAAGERRLPRLVERLDLRGDLQMHTTASDGHQSLAEMAEAARAVGLEYILITDHTHGMAVAGGQTVEDLAAQVTAIRSLNATSPGIRIMAGAEVEIRADGSLDFPDHVLASLDLVVASLHTGLQSGRERTTERMLAAIRNPHVDIIAHPTGRLIGRREGADLDMEAVLRAAVDMDAAIEINAHPDRLDLPAQHVRRAVDLGVKLAINSDAHDVADLNYLFFGVATARRGWAEPKNVINTWDLDRLLAWARQRAM